jgi:hypothetical protein
MKKLLLIAVLFLFPAVAFAGEYRIVVITGTTKPYLLTIRERLEDNLYREHIDEPFINSAAFTLNLKRG